MSVGEWMVRGVIGGSLLAALSGCVALEKHQALQAAYRQRTAENKQLEMDLQDERSINASLRDKADHLEQERVAFEEVRASLRSENEILEQMLRDAQAEASRVASRQQLAPITITGRALPKELDDALQAFAQSHPSAVAYDQANGVLRWKSDLLFAFASDAVAESSKQLLSDFAGILNAPAADAFEVVVVGHTDNRPIKNPGTRERHPTNWHLSAHRAIAVARVLIADGFDPGRVGVMGRGEFQPVADNTTAAGASRNRRVEILIVPEGTLGATAGAARLDDASRSVERTTP